MAEYKTEFIYKWGYNILVVYARRKPFLRRITPWIVVHMEIADTIPFIDLEK
jgi:hypothetical protein